MTEKQVVPKYVADWIEYCKDNNFRLLGALAPIGKFGEDLAPDYKGNILKTLAWIKANQDEFAKAWVNGYKVAQPPKCKVLIKGLKRSTTTLSIIHSLIIGILGLIWLEQALTFGTQEMS